MSRSLVALAALCAACDSNPPADVAIAATEQGIATSGITRDHIAGDVYHYSFVLPVGSGPNAKLEIHRVVRERAPWVPRTTTGGLMLMHGDFSTFVTNFLPVLGDPPSTNTGMATWLAERGIDVWGFDRRWTQALAGDADVSDFDAMGLLQELDDVRAALAFSRVIRLVTSGSTDRMHLLGFSRGGELAYFYASAEAARPAWQRHIKGLIPLDVYVSLAPEDEDLRQFFCGIAVAEYQLIADGFIDGPNDLQIAFGRNALNAPDDPTPIPFLAGLTNREAMLDFVGATYFYFPASPRYHLAGPFLDANFFAVGLRYSSEDDMMRWLAGSAPHQSMREQADTDAMTCGDAPLPADLPLSRIQVPLMLIAAAGGYGAHAVHSTTQVGSSDVTTLLIRLLPPGREGQDFGHADLLFSPDAPALAWQPLLSWLQSH
jgi:pimeloyl-ACP methyl ester carboxylesterase